MKVGGKHVRSIWLEPDGWSVSAIDQRRLPHDFVVARLTDCDGAADAIRSMLVRGAPLIGATAAYGMALAMRADASDAALDRAYALLVALALLGAVPRLLVLSAALYPLHVYASLRAVRSGLTFESLRQLQRCYRLSYAVIGIMMVLTVPLSW